jgi:N-acetylglutamate synthase-like GNAT family acetyltransferase/2-polyprenyl-3-methyl-5-hydroxy-6-metoxy-1,4-benzoquinol methylase
MRREDEERRGGKGLPEEGPRNEGIGAPKEDGRRREGTPGGALPTGFRDDEELRRAVSRRYAEAVRSRRSGASAPGRCCGSGGSCCGSGSGSPEGGGPGISEDLYDPEALRALGDAAGPSFGCGDPGALASLRRGEVVVDLGSGAGLDALFASLAVGPEGRVYGVDMTEAMLEEARENARRFGAENLEFREGTLEAVPLPEGIADAVISNCVFNLSPDKERAFREALRILKPGGRLAISDMVFLSDPPEGIARSLTAWAGCAAGALSSDRVRTLLEAVGFEAVSVTPRRAFSFGPEEAERLFPDLTGAERSELNGLLASADIRGRRPEGQEEAGTTATLSGEGASPPGSDRAEGPPKTFRTRPARPEEREAIRSFLRAGNLHAEVSPEEIPLFRVAREEDGRVVGAIGLVLSGKEALIRSLATAPDRRGRGVGRALVGSALEEARTAGATRAWLLTVDAEGYFPGLGFHRRENRDFPAELRTGSCAPGLCPDTSACFSRDL